MRQSDKRYGFFVFVLVVMFVVSTHRFDKHSGQKHFYHPQMTIGEVCSDIKLNGMKKTHSLSQIGQDYLLIKVFEKMQFTGGKFIDLAAAFPQRFSNTFLLEACYGWTGLCVEGDEKKIKNLKRDRTCTVVDKCISNKRETVSFETQENSGVSGVRGFAQAFWADLEFKTKETYCYTFNDMVVEHDMGNGHRIDFMSLDVEGYEGKILEGMLETELIIDIFLPEVSHCCARRTQDAQRVMILFLEKNDYVPIVALRGNGHGFHCGNVRQKSIASLFSEGVAAQYSDILFVRSDSRFLPYFLEFMTCE